MADRINLEPPESLSPAAQSRWRVVMKLFQRHKRSVDRDRLEGYCQVWARWKQAEDGIGKAGQLVRDEHGRARQSPLVGMANQTASRVLALEKRLGIDVLEQASADRPSGRTGSALLTRREVAQVLGVHMQTVTKWEREGLPIAKRGNKGRPSGYREGEIRAWLAAREAAAQRTGVVDVAAERARKERAQAILAEQTFEARARQLLPIVEVERAWNSEVQAVRAAILSTYTTAADRLHRIAILEGVEGVEAELKTMATNLLRELSAADRALPDDHEGQDHAA